MGRTAVRSTTLAALMVLLVACSGKDDREAAASAAGEGREETRLIRNTENIGVSGNAIGAKVDGALDANAERADQLDQQLERSGSGE